MQFFNNLLMQYPCSELEFYQFPDKNLIVHFQRHKVDSGFQSGHIYEKIVQTGSGSQLLGNLQLT